MAKSSVGAMMEMDKPRRQQAHFDRSAQVAMGVMVIHAELQLVGGSFAGAHMNTGPVITQDKLHHQLELSNKSAQAWRIRAG